MNNDKTGEPAFPLLELNRVTGDVCYQHFGVTVRDYFAAMAMQGLLACPEQPQSDEFMFARDAYTMADAMLKARES